jgi:hypothetical protein
MGKSLRIVLPMDFLAAAQMGQEDPKSCSGESSTDSVTVSKNPWWISFQTKIPSGYD